MAEDPRIADFHRAFQRRRAIGYLVAAGTLAAGAVIAFVLAFALPYGEAGPPDRPDRQLRTNVDLPILGGVAALVAIVCAVRGISRLRDRPAPLE